MEGAELKLYGSWASPFCLVVEMALQLKGIPYTYQEENIADKSESLLRHNPIHKKIPVLLHNGRPIAESLVILEYIEETWKETSLLPSDPYERARFRFWIAFLYDKVLNSFLNLMFNSFIDFYRFSLTFLCFSIFLHADLLWQHEEQSKRRQPGRQRSISEHSKRVQGKSFQLKSGIFMGMHLECLTLWWAHPLAGAESLQSSVGSNLWTKRAPLFCAEDWKHLKKVRWPKKRSRSMRSLWPMLRISGTRFLDQKQTDYWRYVQ